ncbi:uncharacterized protein M6B38_344330 [Iris pallida]|uniref:Epoxide hydrolase n=1 Tax=Iris pallida TaxID=29817 RepID=A0AAX6GVG4_IRIPA|nr:uncharacterized protein M6B38_344330 [Iris pallida]
MFRPDKVKALVNLSVPFMSRNPAMKPEDYFRLIYGDEHYICRFQEPGGAAEAEFARLGTKLVLKKFFAYRNLEPMSIPKEGWGSPDDRVVLPSWISEEDVEYFASKFDKTGFSGPINYYRNFDLNLELTSPWTGVKIKVPTKFIIGDLDMSYHYPGIQEYIHKGGFKKDVPLLEEVIVMPGVGHYINQEKAHEITHHILEFIQKF